MPEISRFFGMVIAMYYNDHAPPHFHVRYGRPKSGHRHRPDWRCWRGSYHRQPAPWCWNGRPCIRPN